MKIYHFIKLESDSEYLSDNRPRTWTLCSPHTYRYGSPAYFFEDSAKDQIKILKNYNIPAYLYKVMDSSYRVCVSFDDEADEAEFILRTSGGFVPD